MLEVAIALAANTSDLVAQAAWAALVVDIAFADYTSIVVEAIGIAFAMDTFDFVAQATFAALAACLGLVDTASIALVIDIALEATDTTLVVVVRIAKDYSTQVTWAVPLLVMQHTQAKPQLVKQQLQQHFLKLDMPSIAELVAMPSSLQHLDKPVQEAAIRK